MEIENPVDIENSIETQRILLASYYFMLRAFSPARRRIKGTYDSPTGVEHRVLCFRSPYCVATKRVAPPVFLFLLILISFFAIEIRQVLLHRLCKSYNGKCSSAMQ